jgi:hypothetical protein
MSTGDCRVIYEWLLSLVHPFTLLRFRKRFDPLWNTFGFDLLTETISRTRGRHLLDIIPVIVCELSECASLVWRLAKEWLTETAFDLFREVKLNQGSAHAILESFPSDIGVIPEELVPFVSSVVRYLPSNPFDCRGEVPEGISLD